MYELLNVAIAEAATKTPENKQLSFVHAWMWGLSEKPVKSLELTGQV